MQDIIEQVDLYYMCNGADVRRYDWNVIRFLEHRKRLSNLSDWITFRDVIYAKLVVPIYIQ